MAYALRVVEQMRITGRSIPGRIFVLETLGGPTEHLALAVARAAGIAHVLVPGGELHTDGLAELAATGEAILVMSEGAGDAVSVGSGDRRAHRHPRPPDDPRPRPARRAADERGHRARRRRRAAPPPPPLARGESAFVTLPAARLLPLSPA